MALIETLPEIDVHEFRKVVESRRSVRKFDGTPIPLEVLRQCLDLALLAPNSSNLQPWEFYLVRSPEKLKLLIPACLNQNAAKTANCLIVVVARTNTWKQNSKNLLAQWPEAEGPPKIVRDYYTHQTQYLYAQGLGNSLGWVKRILGHIIGFMRPIPRSPHSHAEMKIWAAKSCALAANTLMLALRAYGFDSCPMEGFDEKRVRHILSLPGDAFVVMVIAAGKRREDGVYNRRFRFSREQVVHEV